MVLNAILKKKKYLIFVFLSGGDFFGFFSGGFPYVQYFEIFFFC